MCAHLLLLTALSLQQTLLIDLSILPRDPATLATLSRTFQTPTTHLGNQCLPQTYFSSPTYDFPEFWVKKKKALMENTPTGKSHADNDFTPLTSATKKLWRQWGSPECPAGSWDAVRRPGPCTRSSLMGLMSWLGRQKWERKDKPWCNTKGQGSDYGWLGCRWWG